MFLYSIRFMENIPKQMNINSRRKVKEFVEKIKSGALLLLRMLVLQKHFHTVKADSVASIQ